MNFPQIGGSSVGERYPGRVEMAVCLPVQRANETESGEFKTAGAARRIPTHGEWSKLPGAKSQGRRRRLNHLALGLAISAGFSGSIPRPNCPVPRKARHNVIAAHITTGSPDVANGPPVDSRRLRQAVHTRELAPFPSSGRKN